MIVRFRMSKDAKEAKELTSKLSDDHYCPLGGPDGLIGFVKKVEEEDDRIYITAEISEPDTVDSITKRYGYAEPVEVDVNRMSMNIPLFGYVHSRFPRCSPEIHVHGAEER